jgi:hypothetical protein
MIMMTGRIAYISLGLDANAERDREVIAAPRFVTGSFQPWIMTPNRVTSMKSAVSNADAIAGRCGMRSPSSSAVEMLPVAITISFSGC